VSAEAKFLQQTLQELYDIAPCGYLRARADGSIEAANATFLEWTGYSLEELTSGKRLPDLLTVPGRIFYETQFAPLLHMQRFVKEVAFEIVRPGKDPLPVLINAAQRPSQPGQEPDSHYAFFDATDRRRYEDSLLASRKNLEEEVRKRTVTLNAQIAERTKMQDDLRELTSRLLNLRDIERRSLARELHDSVGQLLAAINMNLSVVAPETSKLSARAAAALAENASLVDQIGSEIRTISHLLHPPLLDEIGLASALSWYVEGFGTRANMQIQLELPTETERLPEFLEIAIFRIVQECLTNINRHSGSETATVSLRRDEESVELIVADKGQGMPAGQPPGVGLRGIKERLAQFGGTLEIESGSTGTTVKARIPLQKS
jgi:signal transduction histidine kinase